MQHQQNENKLYIYNTRTVVNSWTYSKSFFIAQQEKENKWILVAHKTAGREEPPCQTVQKGHHKKELRSPTFARDPTQSLDLLLVI